MGAGYDSQLHFIPLTTFACVGIINAINLIDGVDGYSSGYSIVSCILFGAMFYTLGNIRMATLAAIVGFRSFHSSCITYSANTRKCSSGMPEHCR